MKRYGVPAFSPLMPCGTVPAFQNDFSAVLAWPASFACSKTLVTITYQLPMDMMLRMISGPRQTKSPSFHSASSPYGFSTTSLSRVGGGVGVGAPAVSILEGSAAVDVGVDCFAGACALVIDAVSTNAAPTARIEARAKRRYILDMFPPH